MTSFKEFEKNAWELKASGYNDTWGRVTSQVFDTIIDIASSHIKSPHKHKFLDIGCGPGHLCHKAKLHGFNPVGCDYSEAMVRIAALNYPEISFKKEDAESLSFSDKSFDVATLNYLLLHVPNQEKTLLEAKRILTTKGLLISSNWLPPKDSPGLSLIFEALKKYADMTVIPPAQDIFMFSESEYAVSFLKKHFKQVSHKKFDSYWHVKEASEFFTAVQAGTRMGGLIDLQKPEIKEKIKQEILENIQKFKVKKGGFLINTPTIIYKAIK